MSRKLDTRADRRRLRPSLAGALAALALAAAAPASAAPAEQARTLEELRNTVFGLVDALVANGVITREAADGMIRQAQQRAAAAPSTSTADVEPGAVRVPYVPEPVREQIARQVADEVSARVSDDVLARARTENWNVPDWAQRIRLSGDLRMQLRGDFFDSANARNAYLNVPVVNARGGIARAGAAAFANTTEDRTRLRARLRFGAEADLGGGFAAGLRLATGNIVNPVSTNQTLASYGQRYEFGLDQAFLRWSRTPAGAGTGGTVWIGRLPNPFVVSDLVFDNDLQFDGAAASLRHRFLHADDEGATAYLTLGAFPLDEVELSTRDKYLFAGQVGLDWQFGRRHQLRAAVALFDYSGVTGVANAPDSTLNDFTAPRFVQRGNTLFDIRNDLDPTTELFALAADYRIVHGLLAYEMPVGDELVASLTGEWLRNVGYDEAEVALRNAAGARARVDGYQAGVVFGHPNVAGPWRWRTALAYRYLQRDAVLDAFADSELRGGGTDVKGYLLSAELGLTPRAWLRGRWLSADEIDGAPFALDVLQLELMGRF